MNKLFFLGALLMMGVVFLVSCEETKNPPSVTTKNLTLSINKLENLGSNFLYEGWIMVNGKPVSTGTFSVNDGGVLSKTSFAVPSTDLTAATAFILTIEPKPDTDPQPSSTKLLAGDFAENTASIKIDHASALKTDFTSATGKYILSTPTDGNGDMNEKSGIWWLDNSATPAVDGLSLPTLPAGWKYEGWAVVNGTPLSTGTFTSASAKDEAAPFSGSTAGPNYPGEDFLQNAPSGLTFPLDLSGAKAVISVEPFPDNSANPFLLKPLVSTVSATVVAHALSDMVNDAAATNPSGTASR